MMLRRSIIALLVAVPLAAQSVDPPIAIFDGTKGRAQGKIVINNPTLYPLAFVLEPKRFIVACGGDVAFGEIDTAHVHLRLSAMSGRLGARQHATIFYEVRVDSLPAWFAIVAGFSAARPEPGLSVRVEIPHIVYLMQRERVTAADVAITTAVYSPTTKQLRVRVENHSAKLTRLSDVIAVSRSGKEYSIDACPLFPNNAREFDFAWPESAPPVTLIAKFPDFSIQQAIAIAPAAAPGAKLMRR